MFVRVCGACVFPALVLLPGLASLIVLGLEECSLVHEEVAVAEMAVFLFLWTHSASRAFLCAKRFVEEHCPERDCTR